MNLFGIGPMEMAVIGVIALLIFGPEKLPEVMGQAGKAVRDFRRMTSQFTSEFEDTIAEAKALTGELSNELNSVTGAKKKTTTTTTSKTAAKSTTSKATTSKTTTTSKSSSTSKSGTAAKSTTTTASKTTTSTAAKPATPVATREDPTNAFSLFEPTVVEKPRRNRTASPKAITDLLPRDIFAEGEPALNGSSDSNGATLLADVANDPLARARQRRKTAGYNRARA